MNFIHRKKKFNWQIKKYLYIINDITGTLLQKENEDKDKRIKYLSLAIIILAIVLIVSCAYNVYLVTGGV